jgi:hypothetical protein
VVLEKKLPTFKTLISLELVILSKRNPLMRLGSNSLAGMKYFLVESISSDKRQKRLSDFLGFVVVLCFSHGDHGLMDY